MRTPIRPSHYQFSVAEVRKASTQPVWWSSTPRRRSVTATQERHIMCLHCLPLSRGRRLSSCQEQTIWRTAQGGSGLALILNSRAETNKNTVVPKWDLAILKCVLSQSDWYWKRLRGAFKVAKSQRLTQAGASGAVAKRKLASRFVRHEERWCFLPNTLRKDMKTLEHF